MLTIRPTEISSHKIIQDANNYVDHYGCLKLEISANFGAKFVVLN